MHSCEENLVRQFICYDWKFDEYICSECGRGFQKHVTAGELEVVVYESTRGTNHEEEQNEKERL